MSKMTIKVHESHGSMQVWAIKCDDADTASDEEYYLRDGWGPFVNTAVLGDTIYVECEGDEINKMTPEKIEKIVREWFPNNKIEKIVAPKEVEDLLFNYEFESKKSESADDDEILDLLTELAYKVESIVDSNPDYVCYYDGGKTYPEIYDADGNLMEIGGKKSNVSVDSQIDEWQEAIRSSIKDGKITKDKMFTEICLGIPYQKDTQDYTAGVDMPTQEEWATTEKLFDPNYYDVTIGTQNVWLETFDDIRKWIDTH